MGTSLTGLTPSTTYDALIKVGDNGPLSATAKVLSDGLGNDSVLALSTTSVGIGTTTPLVKLHVSGQSELIRLQSTASFDNTIAFYEGSTPIGSIGRLSGGSQALGIITTTASDIILYTNSAERARFTANGLTFNGDTAAANALDDYEEGNWTPVISFGSASTGITYAVNQGYYTKIGNQVTLTSYILLTNKGSSTGVAKIEGLPFTINSSSRGYSAPSFGALNAITFSGQFQGYGNIGSSTIDLVTTTLLGIQTAISNTDFTNATQIIMTFSYFV